MLGFEPVAGYFELTIDKVKEFERCVPWMYRDATGAVAVGASHQLQDEGVACELPFLIGEDPADDGQIAVEFERVEALPAGEPREFYRMVGAPELPLDAVDDDVRATLTKCEQTFQAGLAGYDTLPDGVKMAFLDMGYTLGPTKVLTGFPLLLNAIEMGSWAQAAKECVRENVSAERNLWTRQQMLTAVVATIRAGFLEDVRPVPPPTPQPKGFFARMLRALPERRK